MIAIDRSHEDTMNFQQFYEPKITTDVKLNLKQRTKYSVCNRKNQSPLHNYLCENRIGRCRRMSADIGGCR